MSKNYTYRPSDHLRGGRSYYHGDLQPLDNPTPRRARPIGRLLLWVFTGIALFAAFDYMMTRDKANLCASEATAYEGCRR